jgi:hypothetical protein
MSFKMNQSAYQKLIDEDLAWLMQQPRTLERDHIAMIVKKSVKMYYPEPPEKALRCGTCAAIVPRDTPTEPVGEGLLEEATCEKCKAESTLPPRSWRKVCICRTKDLANECDNRRTACSTPQCTCPCHPENR